MRRTPRTAQAAWERHRLRKRWLAIHAAVFAIVNAAFAGTWLVARDDPSITVQAFRDGRWVLYQLIGWGVLLGVHAVSVWARKPADDVVPVPGRTAGRVVRTVLFTDIVGSTELAASLGDARWTERLAQHDRVAGRLAARSGGRIVKHTGDGLLAIFESPEAAIRYADELRTELRRQGLEIRAGLHAGEIDLRGGDVAGIGVHIASRVLGAARPSEILASRTVRDLTGGSGIAFDARGSRPLKGLDGEWELYAVAAS
jgi:class 3 adenylate cyclase